MASPEWAELEADGEVGFEMTKLYGGFVREHVMRWEGLSDGRVCTPPPATSRVLNPTPLQPTPSELSASECRGCV